MDARLPGSDKAFIGLPSFPRPLDQRTLLLCPSNYKGVYRYAYASSNSNATY